MLGSSGAPMNWWESNQSLVVNIQSTSTQGLAMDMSVPLMGWEYLQVAEPEIGFQDLPGSVCGTGNTLGTCLILCS